jgi:hypothetical protein
MYYLRIIQLAKKEVPIYTPNGKTTRDIFEYMVYKPVYYESSFPFYSMKERC